jgi:hypothetical protein
MSSNSLKVVKPAKVNTIFIKSLYIKWNVSSCDRFSYDYSIIIDKYIPVFGFFLAQKIPTTICPN